MAETVGGIHRMRPLNRSIGALQAEHALAIDRRSVEIVIQQSEIVRCLAVRTDDFSFRQARMALQPALFRCIQQIERGVDGLRR